MVCVILGNGRIEKLNSVIGIPQNVNRRKNQKYHQRNEKQGKKNRKGKKNRRQQVKNSNNIFDNDEDNDDLGNMPTWH